jgi:hydroxyacylglutathione hydrolase
MSRRRPTSFALNSELDLHVLPGFEDNYFYLLSNRRLKNCAVVDPGAAPPLLDAIKSLGFELTDILLTHHHRDHTGGVPTLKAEHPSAKIICSEWFKIPDIWQSNNVSRLKAGGSDRISVLEQPVGGLDVRGHTVDHIAFMFFDPVNHTQVNDVFVGDALFGAGCGGLFEGSYEQMFAALNRLRKLPSSSRLWCAHEYTLKNLRVAVQLGEVNRLQTERLASIERSVALAGVLEHEWMTIPLTIAEEIETNPFFRWDSPNLQKAIDTRDGLETFTQVRKFRDKF